jgi:4-amino-4-deoxy-L-arabinose transferase-like glycosyltransferase
MILTIVLVNISLHSVAPPTDTALFLDQARSLLSNGRINSNVLHSTIPGYYSISPQHMYVPFYYAQFMMFLGPSYESAKIANIFAALSTVLVLSLLATLINGYKAGLLSAFLCLLTPRLPETNEKARSFARRVKKSGTLHL